MGQQFNKLATLSTLDEALVFTGGSFGSFISPLGTNKTGVKSTRRSSDDVRQLCLPARHQRAIWDHNHCDRAVIRALLALNAHTPTST